MNVIVAVRPEPVYSYLGSVGVISASPLPLVPILILLGLIGSFVAAWPMLQKPEGGRRRIQPLNAVLSLGLLCGFAFIAFVLGEEIYRCDILRIPNCD